MNGRRMSTVGCAWWSLTARRVCSLSGAEAPQFMRARRLVLQESFSDRRGGPPGRGGVGVGGHCPRSNRVPLLRVSSVQPLQPPSPQPPPAHPHPSLARRRHKSHLILVNTPASAAAISAFPRYAVVTAKIRLRFDGRSTAYRKISR